MRIIFGAGTKFSPKKNGKTIFQRCPSCDYEGEFQEVVKTEYISLFFIPVIEESSDKITKPHHQCPNCKSVFIFAGTPIY